MKENHPSDNHINRRQFLRKLGAATAVVGSSSLVGCNSNPSQTQQAGTNTPSVQGGGMTIRTTPTTGDKVGLLGYGCLRWYMFRDKETGIIDQEQVNRLVDYAIEHGVNYFDTAPVYCDGECERVTGIALNRHPRDKWFIAAKIANFEPETWSREATLKGYENSFKELQVDYIDYMLMHGIGMDGMEELENRFLKNGVLDYLLEERKKGRIRNLGFSFHGDVKVFDYLMQMHDEKKYTWDFAQIQLNYVDWRHAQEEHARNINAEYLYGELAKRNIPAVIMEPLLGGRLANVHAHIATTLLQRRPDKSIASWAFRFVGTHPNVLSVLSGMTYMEHLQETSKPSHLSNRLPMKTWISWNLRHRSLYAIRLFHATIANTACLVLTASISQASSFTSTNASTKTACQSARKTKTTASYAAPSSSGTTARYLSSAKPTTVPDATSA